MKRDNYTDFWIFIVGMLAISLLWGATETKDKTVRNWKKVLGALLLLVPFVVMFGVLACMHGVVVGMMVTSQFVAIAAGIATVVFGAYLLCCGKDTETDASAVSKAYNEVELIAELAALRNSVHKWQKNARNRMEEAKRDASEHDVSFNSGYLQACSSVLTLIGRMQKV